MAKKIFWALLIILAIGGIGVGIFAYRNVNKKPAVEVEQQPAAANTKPSESATVLKSGQFADGDSLHKGRGSVSVIKVDTGPILKFENDFTVTNGPDLFVYLSPNASGDELGDFASLGRLKSTSGEQIYNLPENFEDYKSVVIWCRAFSVEFATAELR